MSLKVGTNSQSFRIRILVYEKRWCPHPLPLSSASASPGSPTVSYKPVKCQEGSSPGKAWRKPVRLPQPCPLPLSQPSWRFVSWGLGVSVCSNKRSSVPVESSHVAAFAVRRCVQEILPEMLILGKSPVFLHKSVRSWKESGVCRGGIGGCS